MPLLLDVVEENIDKWSLDSLALIVHSLASLNVGGKETCKFGPTPQEAGTGETVDTRKDYAGLVERCLDAVAKHYVPNRLLDNERRLLDIYHPQYQDDSFNPVPEHLQS